MAAPAVVPILNVTDVPASIDWFAQLGWEQRFTWCERDGTIGFAGIGAGDAEIFLCRDGQGERGTWVSWFLETLEDVEAMHDRAVGLGLDVTRHPLDEPWGIREFHLRHPDGHTFRIGSELHR